MCPSNHAPLKTGVRRIAGKVKKMALFEGHLTSSGGSGRAGKGSSSQGRLPISIERKDMDYFPNGRIGIWL
jgi:hypothetical protein